MHNTVRVLLVMVFLALIVVAGVAAAFFFNMNGDEVKYIKCAEKNGDKSMVVSIDDKQKELVVSGKTISGTDIEVFSDVEILAQWFSSNGHTKFWLDRVTGELNVTNSAAGSQGTASDQTFSCEATRPKL